MHGEGGFIELMLHVKQGIYTTALLMQVDLQMFEHGRQCWIQRSLMVLGCTDEIAYCSGLTCRQL